MTAPVDHQRIAGIPLTDFLSWRRAIERTLAALDSRVASTGRAGTVVNYAGPALPSGLLTANGQVVDRDTYPRLFTAIGTTYNTGGEAGTAFRLPNYTTPPQFGVWAITT